MRAVLPEPTGLWGVEGVGSVGVFFLAGGFVRWIRVGYACLVCRGGGV